MAAEQPKLLPPSLAVRSADLHPRTASLARLGLLTLGFALPALLIYAAALPHFASTIPGGATAQQDGWQNVWNLWWVAFALRHGQNPFATTWLYYPQGISLFWQTLNITNGLLALPITLTLGPVVAYNCLALGSFVFSALGMYWLTRELGASRSAACVAGLLFSFAPLHVARLVDGQLEHMTIQWLPVYLLLLRRGLERGSWRACIGGAALLLWITLTSLYQALSCLILLGLYAGALLVQRWPRPFVLARLIGQIRAIGLRLALILGLWLLPLLGPLLTALGPGDDDWLDSQALHSATPLDFVLPNPNHALWGSAMSSFGQRLHPDAGSWNVALGLVLVLLALLGLLLNRSLRREPWPWLALCCLVLALGPLLVVNGVRSGIPLPYALINLLPGASLGQRPNYLALPALLLLAICAARGLDALLARTQRPTLLLAALGLLILLDLSPAPLALTNADVPEALHDLANDPIPGAVLELPFLPENSAPLQAQIAHQRPIMGGFVSRTPFYPFPLERPALRALWTGDAPDELIQPAWQRTANSVLRQVGIRYLVVRWRSMTTPQRARLATRIAALPQGALQQRYDFQGLSIYQVAETPPLLPFAFQRGMYAAEHGQGRSWQWMGSQAQLVLVNPDTRPRAVLLSWRAEAFGGARDLELALDGENPQPLTHLRVATTPTAGRLQLLLPPGETTLALRSETAAAQPGDPRRLSLAFTRLDLSFVP